MVGKATAPLDLDMISNKTIYSQSKNQIMKKALFSICTLAISLAATAQIVTEPEAEEIRQYVSP